MSAQDPIGIREPHTSPEVTVAQFNQGDRVSCPHPDGGRMAGTLMAVEQDTCLVVLDDGTRVLASPHYLLSLDMAMALERLFDGAETSDRLLMMGLTLVVNLLDQETGDDLEDLALG